jgi:hypothetical protein
MAVVAVVLSYGFIPETRPSIAATRNAQVDTPADGSALANCSPGRESLTGVRRVVASGKRLEFGVARSPVT